jgi:hypothetical protein
MDVARKKYSVLPSKQVLSTHTCNEVGQLGTFHFARLRNPGLEMPGPRSFLANRVSRIRYCISAQNLDLRMESITCSINESEAEALTRKHEGLVG